MAGLGFNRDDEKDFVDSMMEYENYNDFTEENDDTESIPSPENKKSHSDAVIWIVLLIILIVSFIIFLKLELNLLTSACWSMALLSLFFWILSPLIYKNASVNDTPPDKIRLLIIPIILFAIGLVIIGIS